MVGRYAARIRPIANAGDDIRARPRALASRPRRPTLTPREPEVLRLIADRRSNSEIAEALLVSHETVKTFVSRILTKLDLRDRAQAVVYAYRHGLAT